MKKGNNIKKFKISEVINALELKKLSKKGIEELDQMMAKLIKLTGEIEKNQENIKPEYQLIWQGFLQDESEKTLKQMISCRAYLNKKDDEDFDIVKFMDGYISYSMETVENAGEGEDEVIVQELKSPKMRLKRDFEILNDAIHDFITGDQNDSRLELIASNMESMAYKIRMGIYNTK